VRLVCYLIRVYLTTHHR